VASPTEVDQNPDAAELAERIMTAARAAGVGSGGRLPTERQLAHELQVTRTGVRRALARLEAEGLLTREVGRGTFLRPESAASASASATSDAGAGGGALLDVGPADVMAVRELIEPEAMALAVARATSLDLAEMDRCLAGGAQAETYAEFEAWDTALHRCLIDAAHNPLLGRLYESVEAARHSPMWGRLKQRNDSVTARRRYCTQHTAVVEAIRARDEEAAVRAMRAHLANVSANLFGARRAP
jgi:DNA-binding FadR family transcriptional regulator